MEYTVIRTDDTCVVKGKQLVHFPVIVDSAYEINWILTDYLIELRTELGNKMLTIEKYAGYIREVANYFHKKGKAFDEIVHDDLVKYVNSHEAHKEHEAVLKATHFVKALFNAQEKPNFPSIANNFPVRIGINDAGQDRIFPIPIVSTAKKARTQSKFNFRIAISRQAIRDDRIEILKESTLDNVFVNWLEAANNEDATETQLALIERNVLMLDLGLQAATRANEVPTLKINHLPTREAAEEAVENDTMVEIDIVESKFSNSRYVTVNGEIIQSIYDFIDLHRNTIISNRKKNKGNGFRDEGYVFPSNGDGLAITSNWFLKLLKQAADGEKINHQLTRRTGLTNIARAAIALIREKQGVDYNIEDVLMVAQDLGGHKHLSTTLQSYVKSDIVREYTGDTALGRNKQSAEIQILKKQLEEKNEELSKLRNRS